MEGLESNLGDGFIQKLVIDFKSKTTEIIIEKWYGENNSIPHNYSVKFTDVILQEFEKFDQSNILYSIDEVDNFNDLEIYWKDYITKMNNYLTGGLLEQSKNNPSNKYYNITSSQGVEGFVICKAMVIKLIN